MSMNFAANLISENALSDDCIEKTENAWYGCWVGKGGIGVTRATGLIPNSDGHH